MNWKVFRELFSSGQYTVMFVCSNQDCINSNVKYLQPSDQEYITNKRLCNSLLNNLKQKLTKITNNPWVMCEYKKEFANKFFDLNYRSRYQMIHLHDPLVTSIIHFPVLFFCLHRLPQKYSLSFTN